MIVLATAFAFAFGAMAPPGTDPPVTTDDVPSPWLEWSAPPECPDRDHVLARVARLVPNVVAPEHLRATAELSIVGDRATLRLALEHDGFMDGRMLEASTCEAVVRAAALLIAVAIDPVTTATTIHAITPDPPPPRALEPSNDVPESTTPPIVARRRPIAITPTSPVSSRSVPPTFTLAAGGMGEIGVFPRGAFGSVLGLGLAWPRIRAEVLGHAVWAPGSIETRSGVAVRAQQFTGAARACARLRPGSIEVPLCLGLEAGLTAIDSRTPGRARDDRGPWTAAIASLGLVWPAEGIVAVRLDAGLAVPIYGVAYRVGNERLTRPSAVTGRANLMLELRLGRDSSPRKSLQPEMNGARP